MTTPDPASTDLSAGPDEAYAPRGEYPRPQMDRSHRWRSLNGVWGFARGAGASPEEEIVVPFAWETAASGVGAHWLDRATYSRRFSTPSEWAGMRTILHFGAVHHHAVVSVDGVVVGEHTGGTVHFEFDITDALADVLDHEVTVIVDAPLDKRSIAHGKQRSIPRDDYDSCTFTPTSGIWQSVWLEARPATHLAWLLALPTDDLTGFRISGRVEGPSADDALVRVSVAPADPSRPVAMGSLTADDLATGFTLSVEDPRLWDPRDPHLYAVTTEVSSSDGVDRVKTLTGLRRIETRGDAILLNGRRITLRGVLDQGYWPDTGMTAPTDEAFIRDLEIARDAGFTLVRKHLKLEDPRFYHHADRMGMLVWAEPASTGRFSPAATAAFASQIPHMVRGLGSHPSIVVWGLYNEEWGLDWALPDDPAKQAAVRDAFADLKRFDPGRPAVDNSGWTHLETDLIDWHVYDEHPRGWATKVRDLVDADDPSFPVSVAVDVVVDKALMIGRLVPRDVPFLNSEFGGGWTSIDRGWNLHWQTQELRRHDRIAGWVWTELNDVEHESAGIVDANRTMKDNGGRPPHHANAETSPVFDITPEAPGRDLMTASGSVRFDVAVSHHGAASTTVAVLASWGAPFGLAASTIETTIGSIDVLPFELSAPLTVDMRLPEGWNAGRLHVTLRAEDGEIGRGAVDVVRS